MKLLVIAWYFPPTNTIAAVRLGEMCRFMMKRGHEVRVITARGLPFPQTLPLEIPSELVRYTPWADRTRLPSAVIAALRKAQPGRAAGRPGSAASDETQAASSLPPTIPNYRSVSGWLKASLWGAVNWPDRQIGWLPHALGAGLEILADWRADLIYASGPPFTTFVIGDRLSRRFRVPLVTEFRDRWSDDPYYPDPAWLRARHRRGERRIVSRAAGITTVSRPWAETYRRRYGKPTKVIYNGFNEDLFVTSAEQCAGSPDKALRIVYTGGIYPGRRDPAPLFRALRLVPDFEKTVRIEFFGTHPGLVWPEARQHGVAAAVAVHPGVDHDEAVRQQQVADILLLMQWNDPREQGNVPGKFFEYLGARRPILVLGLEEGVPATILRERQAGVCLNHPDAIAAQLREWIALKARDGRIPALPEAAREGFCRLDQNRELEAFLTELRPSAPA
jgi:hypothetical protein